MANYNVTASRFSLPNSGLANSGESKKGNSVMSNFTLTISIGRNIPQANVSRVALDKAMGDVIADPTTGTWLLSEIDWLKFQEGVETIFRDGMANTRAVGVSIWRGDVEETCVLQWFNADKPTVHELDLLRELANEYGQESVAVTYAEPTFI